MGLVGTTDEVLRAFVRGEPKRTVKAPVPGAYRVVSVNKDNGETSLYSYNTVVAVRHRDGSVAITTRKYSVTTSKLVSALRQLVGQATDEVVHYEVRVPGRWGGFGPAWHPTGREVVAFIVHGVKR